MTANPLLNYAYWYITGDTGEGATEGNTVNWIDESGGGSEIVSDNTVISGMVLSRDATTLLFLGTFFCYCTTPTGTPDFVETDIANAIALDSTDEFIYVLTYAVAGGNDVLTCYVVSLAGFDVVTSFEIASFPTGGNFNVAVCCSQDNAYAFCLYTAAEDSNNVVIVAIDTSTQSVVATVPQPDPSGNFDFLTPAGSYDGSTLYVGLTQDAPGSPVDGCIVFDVASLSVVTTVADVAGQAVTVDDAYVIGVGTLMSTASFAVSTIEGSFDEVAKTNPQADIVYMLGAQAIYGVSTLTKAIETTYDLSEFTSTDGSVIAATCSSDGGYIWASVQYNSGVIPIEATALLINLGTSAVTDGMNVARQFAGTIISGYEPPGPQTLTLTQKLFIPRKPQSRSQFAGDAGEKAKVPART